MNVPAIAKKTFEELKNQRDFMNIVDFVLESLDKLGKFEDRVELIHSAVDEFNKEPFSHPLVKQMSPCKLGCSACCHTQVSVTEDEGNLLVKRIKEGASYNEERLKLQKEAGNDTEMFYRLKFEDRRCIFLDDEGACGVYQDRPSVCRTNAVLGSADQCDTSQEVLPTRLIKTQKSDLVIYASFVHSARSGTLPFMVNAILEEGLTSTV